MMNSDVLIDFLELSLNFFLNAMFHRFSIDEATNFPTSFLTCDHFVQIVANFPEITSVLSATDFLTQTSSFFTSLERHYSVLTVDHKLDNSDRIIHIKCCRGYD